MSYDVSKLVKLAALKSLAERIESDYATKDSVNTLAAKIDNIEVPTVGELAKLNYLSVNSTKLSISSIKTPLMGENGSLTGTKEEFFIDIPVPTKTSELTNNSGYQTATEVAAAVAAGVAAADHITRRIVSSVDDIDLTADDADKYIYMVSKDGADGDQYDEYMVLNGVLEKVGDWSVDLSDYVQKEDGKGLSSNDFTDADKEKLEGIAEGATKVTASSVPGAINVDGNQVDVVKIATDSEVGEMLNDIFGAPFETNFAEFYGITLPDNGQFIKLKVDGDESQASVKVYPNYTIYQAASAYNTTIQNNGYTMAVDPDTGHYIVTNIETGEAINYTLAAGANVFYSSAES